MNTDDLHLVLRQLTGCPRLTVSLLVRTPAGTLAPRTISTEINQAARTAQVRAAYANGLEEELFLTWNGPESVWQRRLRNGSTQPISLVETGLRFAGVAFGKECADDYFYHAENPRIYNLLTIPVRMKRTPGLVQDSGFDVVAGNRWADPGVVTDRVGASPYQPFPAVLLANYRSHWGLVHGSLSQRVFYHNHLFCHEDGAVTWEMLSSLKAVSHRDLAPGEILDSDRWYLGVTGARDYEAIFAGYAAALRQHLPSAWGRTAINRHAAVWGSWNEGICLDVDEPRLLAMADFIRENLPTVEWLQLDSGYCTLSAKWTHGLGAPYEGTDAFDRQKFPQGLKHYTDEVRRRGLKPALWIGGFVPDAAPLGRDHPEWFCDYSYRVTDQKPLDVSQPAARAYMQHALDVLLTESGFEGMKHDFWSYAFEDSHPLLRHHDRSGYEWRTWWLREIRRRLPDYGYLQTGCDIVMGNPFLGEYFTNYRYGIDVGSGEWEHFRTNFLWGAACVATHTGDLFVPNSDAIGLFRNLPDAEALTWINYCLISRSLVEVAGWLYQTPDHPRMRWVRKALACLNNGQDVHFAQFDYRQQNEAPAIWYLTTPHFSRLGANPCLPRRTVAVFNLGDKPRRLTIRPMDLQLSAGRYLVTDVWSATTARLGEALRLPLAPHASRLLAITPADSGPQILDADVEVTAATSKRSVLTFTLRHQGAHEILLSARPVRVEFSGLMKSLKISRGRGNWKLQINAGTPGTLIARGARS